MSRCFITHLIFNPVISWEKSSPCVLPFIFLQIRKLSRKLLMSLYSLLYSIINQQILGSFTCSKSSWKWGNISYIPCWGWHLAAVTQDCQCLLGGHAGGRGWLQRCHPQTRDVRHHPITLWLLFLLFLGGWYIWYYPLALVSPSGHADD